MDVVLDALALAKQAHALLPPLPACVRPVHIRILVAMERLAPGGSARVSDINRVLGASLPNTTRFINELVAVKVVRKLSAETDRRVVLIQTTALGRRYMERYVHRLHVGLAEAFREIGASRCAAMLETVRMVHAAMGRVCSNLDSGRDHARASRRGPGRSGDRQERNSVLP